MFYNKEKMFKKQYCLPNCLLIFKVFKLTEFFYNAFCLNRIIFTSAFCFTELLLAVAENAFLLIFNILNDLRRHQSFE